ncbi:hypothetical protein IV102_37495 [bacterium]|nr:hypothetical protein [bacterium]
MRLTAHSVNRRVDCLEVKLEEHTGLLKALDTKIDERFNSLDAKFNTLDAKVVTLDAKLDDRFDTLLRHIDLKTESILSGFRTFRDELGGHSSRIDRLEVVADSHAFRLETLEKKR